MYTLGALFVTFTSNILAEESLSEQCQRYATEDGVMMEQLDEYIMQCIADLQGVEMDSQTDEESPEEADSADRN